VVPNKKLIEVLVRKGTKIKTGETSSPYTLELSSSFSGTISTVVASGVITLVVTDSTLVGTISQGQAISGAGLPTTIPLVVTSSPGVAGTGSNGANVGQTMWTLSPAVLLLCFAVSACFSVVHPLDLRYVCDYVSWDSPAVVGLILYLSQTSRHHAERLEEVVVDVI
jgi:hypothetical protein